MAPASKSSMQRACAAALLHPGITIIVNPGRSNDDNAALGMIKELGAVITETEGNLRVDSGLFQQRIQAGSANGAEPLTLHCGESGLGIRMFTPIASLCPSPISITGSGSLVSRPMDFFDEILPALGVRIRSNKGKLPIEINGPLQPADISIDGSLSSQFLTGLLMAYGKACTKDTTIRVNDLKSRPYIDLTLKVMEEFGYKVTNHQYESFTIHPAVPKDQTINYTVEGDWSGGAFLLVAGAIAGDITITGLDVFSTQADKAILQALIASNAVISIQEKKIEIGPGKLKAFHFNATDCPDLFPPLVALAAYCEGTTVIEGVSRLAHKESNRGLTLQEEFGKMGVEIKLQDDLMLITGGTGVKGAEVHSHHDHRIAMACAVAALSAAGDTLIGEAEAINKSYPDFYDHMKSLGALVSLQGR